MKTPLAAWHTAHGAHLVDDRGVMLPAQFTDPQREYQTVREQAGLIDLAFRTQVRATGEDRRSFLQGMLSNDINALQPEQGCAAALLTEQGRIVADLRVYAAETSFLLDLDTRVREKMTESLERFIIADDVELTDLSTEQAAIALQGPLASRILLTTGITTPPTQEFHHCEVVLGETPVRLIRASDTGEDGYEIWVPTPQIESVWRHLLQVGEPLGLCPVGLTAMNALRIEAGIPWYGLDMDDGRLVLEVGLDNAISYSKGCYLGQEVVERATARGHINRKLSGLLVQGNTLPESGEKLFHDSQEVGWITSAGVSPRLGRPIALGYIRREYQTPGTQLRIDRSGIPMIAEITPLPFP